MLTDFRTGFGSEAQTQDGLDLWVADNDRSKQFKGQMLGDLKNMKSSLPLQFAPATMKTIQLIDVLWIQGNAIVAAFEIESTTSIYSGLLRMSDLKAMQPNLQIPVYLVAPDERRQKVFDEVNRPTFSKLLNPPLVQNLPFHLVLDAQRQGRRSGRVCEVS